MARTKQNNCCILETVTKKEEDISCYILEIVQLIPILKKNSCYVLETVELIPQ